MYNLVTIGDIVLDTHIQLDSASLQCSLKNRPCQLCLEYASKIPIQNSFQSLGGNAANVAVGTTKLGLKTTIISSIGDGANANTVLDSLNKFEVGTDYIVREEKIQTRYSVILNFKGERTILAYHGKRKYSWPKKMPKTEWIYYTGLSEGFKKIQKQLISHIKKNPTINVVFNPGSYQLKNGIKEIKEMLPYADITILNLEEAEIILNTTLKKENNIQGIIKKLIRLGTHEVALTCGEKGAYVGSSDELWYMPPIPIDVIAKTGAGDAFSSGFISARILDYNRPQSLRWGIANSCGVISKVGAQNGLFNRSQIKNVVSNYDEIKPIVIT